MDEVCEGKDFSIPHHEESILKKWATIDPFKNQLKRTENLRSTSSSMATLRHQQAPLRLHPRRHHRGRGHSAPVHARFHITRRFGWDCHGLPIEYEIDKKLGIKTYDDVLAMGITAYSEECRGIVMSYMRRGSFFHVGFFVPSELLLTRLETPELTTVSNDKSSNAILDIQFLEKVEAVKSVAPNDDVAIAEKKLTKKEKTTLQEVSL